MCYTNSYYYLKWGRGEIETAKPLCAILADLSVHFIYLFVFVLHSIEFII